MKKYLFIVLALLVAACEKPILDEEMVMKKEANVILHMTQLFPSNKVTDTFYYYGDHVVTDSQQSYDLVLARAVAMFRLMLNDEEIPSNVARLKFYYTGDSSTFSPSAGYGCVNSKQTEYRTVAPGLTPATPVLFSVAAAVVSRATAPSA